MSDISVNVIITHPHNTSVNVNFQDLQKWSQVLTLVLFESQQACIHHYLQLTMRHDCGICDFFSFIPVIYFLLDLRSQRSAGRLPWNFARCFVVSIHRHQVSPVWPLEILRDQQLCKTWRFSTPSHIVCRQFWPPTNFPPNIYDFLLILDVFPTKWHKFEQLSSPTFCSEVSTNSTSRHFLSAFTVRRTVKRCQLLTKRKNRIVGSTVAHRWVCYLWCPSCWHR